MKQFLLAFVVTLAGIALVITALCMPPKGIIDPSVLVAYGETLTFAGAVIGIDYRYTHKNTKP